MKIALVHYWLVGMRGGEKVLESFCDLWPEADVFTHVYDPESVSAKIRKRNIKTTFIQKLPFAKKLYKIYLPLMPFAIENIDLTGYDFIISSESGPAKGILTNPDALHICYCHSPMRYIWDQYHTYYSGSGWMTRLMMLAMTPFLRSWDLATASRVDRFVANSAFVASRIRKYYRRDSVVIHPPVAVDNFSITDSLGDYYLAAGQLVRYKRVDLAVEAFTKMGKKLIVAGSGGEEARLRKIAGPSITFIGRPSDAQLGELLAKCRALVFPGEEDFGILPVEAMACGRPVLAYGHGGACETVVDGKTGLFFKKQTVDALCHCVLEFENRFESFDPQEIRRHAEGFRPEVFTQRLLALVSDAQRELGASGSLY